MDNNDPQKAKIEKFISMGIPIPMEKPTFEQPVVNVKDPKMLQRIQEIKNGAKRGEFNEILSTGEKNPTFKPIPEPKKVGQQVVKAPQLESFAPAQSINELALAATLFEDGPSARPVAPVQRGQGSRIAEAPIEDETGKVFLEDIHSRIRAKASSGTFQMPTQTSGFGFREESSKLLNENVNGMQVMVENIATNVAKKVATETIKTVLDEYLSKKLNLNEGVKNTYKKIKDDIVLIEGKYYKLVPVKLKPKQ